MGCFSFLCQKSGKPVLSSSSDGSAVRLFLLKDGKVIEEMHGNYDSYGRVFKNEDESFHWAMDWDDVCDLMFHGNKNNGICAILDSYYNNEIPTERSEDDPNQGWGRGKYGGKVLEPYHRVYLTSKK